MSEDNKIIEKTSEEIFNSMLNSIDSAYDEDAIKAIASLLALPDELFETISETFLFELEKQFNNSNMKLAMATALQIEGINSDNINETFSKITTSINEIEELPENRKDFLKRILLIGLNAGVEAMGNSKKNVSIPIELCHKDAKMPSYANDTDAGMDIYALEDITINPGETVLIKTGLKVAIPAGYELQVRPKSGRALKTKLRVANTPGTIDSGYRDEIGVIIENIEHPIQDIEYDYDEEDKLIIKSILKGKPYVIEKGQKFAQLVLNQVPKAIFFEVKDIKEIEGDRHGGFGSSGLF